MKTKKKITLFILILMIVLGTLTGCKSDGASTNELTVADLNGKTLGVATGTVYDKVAQEDFADSERMYFTSTADAILALEQGKVDAFFADRTVYVGVRWENDNVTYIDESIAEVSCGMILAKDNYNEVLLDQLNDFISKATKDGTIERLEEKWFADTEPNEHADYTKLTGENGTIKVATCDSMRPLSYQKGDMVSGFDIDFLTLFAEEYGYGLDFQGMTFEALIPSVASGKCDIGVCGVIITPERAESVTFTDPYMEVDGVAVVRAESTAQAGFWENAKDGFDKTFVRENRWKLILDGIGVTMLISICAAIAGTLLGFGLYMLSRTDVKPVQRVTKAIAKVYSRIIEGTPVVVILMILFYVVFGKFQDMSGIIVAIIGFTLTFGAFVYDHMMVSVDSVDRGQTEAAYALGYTKNQTFFRIIFPQAMKIFMPSYCGQAVELIKATAVVGYIAVNDLTKVGDVIRSNTYEAFFPLIATAAIYFLLTWILALLLGRIKVRFEPKRRSKEEILKGVKAE